MRRLMNNQQVLEIYKNIIENSQVLANGQQYLEQIIEQVSNFCTLSVSLISDQSIDTKTRNYISSIIKNILSHNWESNHFIASEKIAIRQECLAGVQKSIDDAFVQQNLGDLISSFIEKEGIDDWKEPLNLLIHLTLSEKTLDFYCLLYSKIDNRINQTVPILLERLLPILHQSETVVSRQKCLILYYLAIQSFSFAENSDDQLMRDCLDKTYIEYINIFVKIIQADEKKYYPNQMMVLKDFPNYTEETFKQSLSYLLKYMRKIIDINYELCLRQTPQANFFLSEIEVNQIEELFEKYLQNDIDIEYENHIQLFTNECLNFIDSVMNYEFAESILPILVFPFVNIISNLVVIGKHQEHLISEDPNLFAASEREFEDDITNIRVKTIKSLEKILDNDACKQIAITSIIQISESMFCNRSDQPLQIIYSELQSANNIILIGQTLDGFDANAFNEFIYFSGLPKDKELAEWKGKEVALFLLGSFQEQITSFYEQNGGNAFQFIGNLIQEFSVKYLENVPNQMLMCRYYQCFSQFAIQICQRHEHADIIMKSLIYTLSSENSQALRIIALNCLASVCSQLKENINQLNLFDNVNSIKIVQTIMLAIKESSEDILPQILTSLIPIFSHISIIANIFAESGILIITKLVNHFEGRADIQKKVIDFIAVLAKYPSSYTIIYRDFEQQIISCFKTLENFMKSHNEHNKLKQQDINIIENRVQILKILIQFKNSNEPIFTECQNTLLKLLYVNDDIFLQQEATLCLKQIISSQPQSLLENKQDLKMLFKKLIDSIPTQPEAFSQYLPNLILISYHNNLLEIERDIAESILEKLQECQSYFLVLTFLLFFSRLIEKNPKETIQFLVNYRTVEDESGFSIFFNKLTQNFWFISKDIIKNALYLPLAQLLIIHKNLLSEFTTGDISTDIGFQLFCFLSRALDIEVFPEQYDNHETSESLVSHQEFQQYLIEDISQLNDNRLNTQTKKILTELFQTMYTNENSKVAFENYINQMDFDEKLSIEQVINQLQNNQNIHLNLS